MLGERRFFMNTKKAVYQIGWIFIKILLALLIVFLVYKYCAASYDFGYRVFNEKPVANPPGKEVVVEINSSMSLNDIAKTLEEQNVLRDSRLFIVQVKLHQYEKKITAGSYTLTNAMTNKEIMKTLAGEVLEVEEEEIKK